MYNKHGHWVPIFLRVRKNLVPPGILCGKFGHIFFFCQYNKKKKEVATTPENVDSLLKCRYINYYNSTKI